ncbi:MAG: 6,7-dimethyl-8-ribityllumazine synthase [Bacteroidetes bacterium]|nr:6,7-dimethyl-8-ribityllumazine synthase [Bacteroidota bacterium]
MATVHTNLSNYDRSQLTNSQGKRFAVITAEWNSEITSGLRLGCIDTLLEQGVLEQDIVSYFVPGAVELTYAAAKVLERLDTSDQGFDAIIVIGCVIRGETAHFDYVCQSVTSGVTSLNLQAKIPVVFCVLTDNTIEQSRARSGGIHGNKGVEAAITALKMIQF